jgi:hypothetical protein
MVDDLKARTNFKTGRLKGRKWQARENEGDLNCNSHEAIGHKVPLFQLIKNTGRSQVSIRFGETDTANDRGLSSSRERTWRW